jgi:UDP-N-acetylmuramoyl-L-alanyl-D-glutamate--2,6-diaminopimelate ligase
LSSLAAVVRGAHQTGDAEITGITIDSRDVQPGDLFAALPGSDFDGHTYLEQAIANGAAAVLAEQLPDGVIHPAIIVGDSRRDLAPISAEFFGHPSRELLTIGLTGTDGKTTTTALVQWILRQYGIRTGGIGTLGVQISEDIEVSIGHQTTPESHLVQGFLRQMIEAGTEAVVIEATSHGLAMHRLDGTHFPIAGVTNITQEHLEYHKTIDAYRAAKGILVERVDAAGGTVVLNADDEGAMSLAPLAAFNNVRTYALLETGTRYQARHVVADHAGCTFVLNVDGEQYAVALPLLGEFNVANALCAIGVCHAAGVPVSASVDALSRAPGVHGRMQRLDAGQPFSVVVDYAHTPASLAKALNLLRSLMHGGKLIVVSGSAGERDAVKRPLQGEVMAELADIVIITSEDPRNEDPMAIIHDIEVGTAGGRAQVYSIEDRREAITLAFSKAEPGDVVLLAGKGHETSIIWGFEHRPWDEAAVARELLAPYAVR